jgi:hypothetical protein
MVFAFHALNLSLELGETAFSFQKEYKSGFWGCKLSKANHKARRERDLFSFG